MPPRNKYILRSQISEAKTRQLVRLFAFDLNASQVAQVAGLNRNTVNLMVAGIRERIAAACQAESSVDEEVEVGGSYFGARRVRGVRGRKARGKPIVFGFFKRQGRVDVEIVPDCSRQPSNGLFAVTLTLNA